MTATSVKPSGPDTASPAAMTAEAAFAAIALAAVSWDGLLSKAGSRALRHALDYREPYRHLDERAMVELMNSLLEALRQKGAQHLMVEAAEALSPTQRATAYAVAAEIMRSDGPLQDDERNILANLAGTLELTSDLPAQVHAVMDLLHADVLSAPLAERGYPGAAAGLGSGSAIPIPAPSPERSRGHRLRLSGGPVVSIHPLP